MLTAARHDGAVAPAVVERSRAELGDAHAAQLEATAQGIAPTSNLPSWRSGSRHGRTSTGLVLEVFGHLGPVLVDATNPFDREVDRPADQLGLP